MTTIPPDIHAALGLLIEKQRGVIERLVSTVGEDRARAFVREAQSRLQASNQDDPAATPKTVRGMLTALIQSELPLEQRGHILNFPVSPHQLPPEEHQRWLALCERLGETESPPRKLIRQIIQIVGIEAAEQAASDAEAIEAQGGMLLPDGSRQRTFGANGAPPNVRRRARRNRGRISEDDLIAARRWWVQKHGDDFPELGPGGSLINGMV